jgi:methyl-accepting chemotaxis protein
MEIYYAKSINLRTKVIGAAAILSILFLIGGGIGLYSTNRIMKYTESAYAELQKEDTKGADVYASQLAQAKKDNLIIHFITVGGVLFLIVFSVGITIYFIRTMAIPLNKLVNALQRVSQGDLTVSLFTDRRDEIGEAIGALNVLVDEFHESMQHVVSSEDCVVWL